MDSTFVGLAALTLHHSGDLSALARKVLSLVGDVIAPTINAQKIRKAADAKGYEIVTLAKAKSSEATIEQRAAHRLAIQEIRHQRNIEAIVGQAAKEKIDNVSNEPVDPDWVNQFFRSCENVSEPKMRAIFARILAGEAAKPGSFSRRAVMMAQGMGKEEADILGKASSLIWFHETAPKGAFIPWPESGEIDPFISLDESLSLASMGAMQIADTLSVIFRSGSELRWHKKRFTIKSDAMTRARIITPPAMELSRTFKTKGNARYLAKSLKALEQFRLEPIA